MPHPSRYAVTATIHVGKEPFGVAVNPYTNRLYATNENPGTVSVINTATNKVTGTISVGELAQGVAVDPFTRRASPHQRAQASMAYDAATGTVVLFGGYGDGWRNDTWTWDGTTWTNQHPATRPPARQGASMAYDAATGTVVLFGGTTRLSGDLGDTWTWGSN